MKRIKLLTVLLVLSVSSLFLIKDIYGIFTIATLPNINIITVSQEANYTVIHELMDLNGTTYTEHTRSSYIDLIGTTVSPGVLTLEGFDSPSVQSVTLQSFTGTTVTYRYPRKQYTITINNSGYVTTSTPSGTYYYGQPIHLVADPIDNDNNPFIKWSDNTTNPDYEFLLTGNKTIEPIYAQAYVITYEPENGDSAFTVPVAQNQPLGSLPTVTYDDCVGSTGDYHTRGCTYVYKFEGWYTESTYQNQINENYVPTGDTTLYAKWNKIYFEKAGQTTCDGTNYIDTGIIMFSQLNADKDFIVRFTVDTYVGYSGDRGTIFADMNEVGEPFPGVHFFATSNTNYTMNINTLGNKQKKNNTGFVTGQRVEIRKESGLVFYNYDGGPDVQINDFSNFSTYFDNKATFCAGTNAQGAIYRYFKGNISDLSVELIAPQSYVIHYDANGGTGMMLDQPVKLCSSVQLRPNQFTNNSDSFSSWNTSPDGTGTSYPNNYTITSDLGNNGDIITLYAQWQSAMHYYVHFDANGGNGTMTDQEFTISDNPVSLTQNAYIRPGYEFRGWNTAADGTGTHYDDEEAVKDLSNNDGDIITLYAQWWKVEYSHSGDAVFNGTNTTFIDTGVNIFNSTNIDKDFEIRFTFKSVDSDQLTVTPTQPTFFNVKDESNTSKMPGFNIRFNGSIATLNPSYRWGGNTVNVPSGGIPANKAPIEFIYKREDGVITMQYKYSGFESQVYTLITQSSWTLNQPFATNVAFGGYFDGNNAPGRFFKGTLADMKILMEE